MSKKSHRGHRENDWGCMSLEQLEGSRWGNPSPTDTPLVADCLRLRRIPVDELSLGDMRRLLLQDIGSKFIARRVLPILETNPLVEANLYPGDMLNALSQAVVSGWRPDAETLPVVRSVLNHGLQTLVRGEDSSSRDKLRTAIESSLMTLNKVNNETTR